MGFFDDFIGTVGGALVGGPIGAGLGYLGVDRPNQQRRDARNLFDQQAQLRAQGVQAQLDAINKMKAPSLSPELSARLRALDEQSQNRPLIEDPYFQGQRAQVTQGGRAALSDVQNRQRATGTTGGFSNVGSMNDVYDRLGGQLAQLGSQATQLRDQKAMTAAQARQQILDAQTNFENSRMQAIAAIQAGDAASASQALQAAYQAQQQINQAQQAFFGSLVGVGTQIGASALTGGASTAAPAVANVASGAVAPEQLSFDAPAADSFSQPQLGSALYQPWSAQRSRYGLR